MAILVDPAKLSESFAVDDSTKSVPNLKNHPPLFPWYQKPPDVRPRTSPMTRSGADDVLPMLSMDALMSTSRGLELDKNNNSQEDIPAVGGDFDGMEMETSFSNTKFIEDATANNADTGNIQLSNMTTSISYDGQHKIGTRYDPSKSFCFNPTQTPTVPSIPRSNLSGFLKIRPASCEGCCEDSPLLERFNSLDSEVDMGLNNLSIILSDENVFEENQPHGMNKDQHGQSPFLEFQGTVDYCASENTHSEIGIEKPHWLSVHGTDDSTSTSFTSLTSSEIENKYSDMKNSFRLNGLHDKVSFENKENFFSNPLYETVYGKRHDEDCKVKAFQLRDCVEDFCGQTSRLSPDLVVEDVESGDEDSVLRHVKLAFPSNYSTRWSSLKDLTLSPYINSNINDQSGNHENTPIISGRYRAQSLNSLLSDALSNLELSVNLRDTKCHVSDNDLKLLLHNNTEMKKTIRPRTLFEVKRKSRTSHRLMSKAYIKHHPTIENQKSMSEYVMGRNQKWDSEIGMNTSGGNNCHCDSDSLQRLENSTREYKHRAQGAFPADDTLQSYGHFIVNPQQSKMGKENLSMHDPCNQPKNAGDRIDQCATLVCERNLDQRLVLLFMGGQTDADGIESSQLNIWNCYVY